MARGAPRPARTGEGIHPARATRSAPRAVRCPWEKVEHDYVFEGARGSMSLGDLFRGRGQLIVYHFMFGPDSGGRLQELLVLGRQFQTASSCSFSRAVPESHGDARVRPASASPPICERMGWSFEWVSSSSAIPSIVTSLSLFRQGLRPATTTISARSISAARKRRASSVFAREGSADLPHLFDLCARPRYAQRRLSSARPRAEGA